MSSYTTRIDSQGPGAEGQGFEPWEAFASAVFKTAPFGRSGTPPGSRLPVCYAGAATVVNPVYGRNTSGTSKLPSGCW